MINRYLCTVVILFASTSISTLSAEEKSRAFNPDISANFLGLYQSGTDTSNDRNDVPHDGLSLQEAEIQFTADVDAYFKAVAVIAIAQEAGSTDFGIEPEELYFETLSLPRLTVRIGKFKLALGKHNQLHRHAFPFIDAPLTHQLLVGDEGLNEVAASLAVMLPMPWYSELFLQGFNPTNDELYNSPKANDVGALTRLKNLWDLNDDLTLEIGAGATIGKNQFDEYSTLLAGDLTFKWRPTIGGKYQALIWSSEYLYAQRDGFTDPVSGALTDELGGMVSWLQYQFAQRWWLQGRYEHVGLPHADAVPTANKLSALCGFFPSEFSGLRLQYDYLDNNGNDEHVVLLQYNISIGAHPAHAY